MKTCTIENCSKPRHARGYCQKHYNQLDPHGSGYYKADKTNDETDFLEDYLRRPWLGPRKWLARLKEVK